MASDYYLLSCAFNCTHIVYNALSPVVGQVPVNLFEAKAMSKREVFLGDPSVDGKNRRGV